MMRLMWQSVGSVGGDDIAGAIVRVWAVNKNNCLLLHFVVILGCVCVCVLVCVVVCLCVGVCHKSVYTSIMRARGLKLTHAEFVVVVVLLLLLPLVVVAHFADFVINDYTRVPRAIRS